MERGVWVHVLLDWGVVSLVQEVWEIQDELVFGASTIGLLPSCEYRGL